MPRRKKRSAWGALTQVDDSTWRIRYWSAGPDGYKRRSKTVRGSRLDAERVRSELMLLHSEDAPCPTVAEVWDSYALPDLERRVEDGDLAPDTLVQYRRWWQKHVVPTWGATPCDAVRPLAVQQWLYGLTRSQAANATLVLAKAMDYAVRYGWAQTNPMRERYVMPGRSTVNQRDRGTWTLAELRGVWKRLRGTWMEAAFLLSAFGSARVGESLGVLAGEVERHDLGGVPVALVPITRQVAHHGARIAERTKTAESARWLVLVGSAATRLCDIAESMPPDWPLTNDGMGNVVSQGRFTDSWRRMGMEHRYRNLRNSWQTWVRWELGLETRYIEVLMGHKLKGTTGQHYDRPHAEQLAAVVAAAYRARPYDAGWWER
jgi:hypothetical protein